MDLGTSFNFLLIKFRPTQGPRAAHGRVTKCGSRKDKGNISANYEEMYDS